MREKLLRLLDKEIPHGIVRGGGTDARAGTAADIEATIYCERDSHKAIIIGKQGWIKRVEACPLDMEAFFDCKSILRLVKSRESILHHMGYDKTHFE